MRGSVVHLTLLCVLSVMCVGAGAATTINLVYVHGVQACDTDRQSAHVRLNDLRTALNASLAPNTAAPAYTFTHNMVNLYTEPASLCAPLDSKGPRNMDDWEAGDGCGSFVSGDPGTTAYEWRYRLSNYIAREFPAGNVILIGHSTGARVSVEVAADVNKNGMPNLYNWGVQSKILGVVTVNGMVAGLNGKNYNLVGPTSFNLACKKGDFIYVGDSCPNGNGWCEYAGSNSGVDANDWVAKNKFVLNLVSWASCSPNLWRGLSDGMLPYDAQSSPAAPGLDLTYVSSGDWTPTNGINYGSFCHSAITTASYANHNGAVTSATNHIRGWLVTRAQRVARSGSVATDLVNYMSATPVYPIPPGCPTGFVDGSVAVSGVCKHPDWFDGDDHVIVGSELSVMDGGTCNGAFSWTQGHDSGDSHAAILYFKSHANKVGGVLA